MQENPGESAKVLRELAERLVRRYVRDLLSVDELIERIDLAWRTNMPGEIPQGPALEALARSLCSQTLCEACQLSAGWQREVAFARLREYLLQALGDVGRSTRYTSHEVREEVIQQTFVEIIQSMQRERGRPAQPHAFLAWVRVILHRQLACYWRQQPRQQLLSLEEQEDPWLAEVVDEHALNPLTVVLGHEQREELRAAIDRLRNPNYRAVLLKLYLSDMEASEVAQQLHVPVADIYLWHHRALPALHKQLNALKSSWQWE